MIVLNFKSLNLENPAEKTGVNVHKFPCWPELAGKGGQALLGHQHTKSYAADLLTSKLFVNPAQS